MRRTTDRIALDEARSERAVRSAATVEAGMERVIVPRVVRIRDGFLEWSNEQPGWDHRWSLKDMATLGVLPITVGQRTEAVLDQFNKLYRGSDANIVSFAHRYGVLYLSPSGDPNGAPDRAEYAEETLIDVVPGNELKGLFSVAGCERPVHWHRESLAGWRAWSLLIRTLLLLCLAAREAATPLDPGRQLRDWGLASSFPVDEGAGWYVARQSRDLLKQLQGDRTVEKQRESLGDWLDFLAAHSATTLRIVWAGTDRHAMRLHPPRQYDFSFTRNVPNPVLGDVVVQLMNTLLGDAANRVAICPRCGDPYEAKHRRRGYCSACRAEQRKATRNATWHKNKERYNERRRGRVQLRD